MSTVEAHAQAIAASSADRQANARLARALIAISNEFDAVMAEEIDRLRDRCAAIAGAEASPEARDDLRAAAAMVERDGRLLGHPLIAEIARSLITILDCWAADAAPLDAIDAHVETMSAVLSDPDLAPERASALVADLAAAAADYVAAAGAPVAAKQVPVAA